MNVFINFFRFLIYRNKLFKQD